ncbi:MAG: hypothetical protein HY293_11885 [Planctomycetes bacterium]|nr:hypothetical protein [Planctomycetota bacterium]
MTKPFGKSVHHGRGLTKGLRLTIALWVAALPAYFLCGAATRKYPTLSESPFFWPATWGFMIFYASAFALWLRRRPSPRAPGSSSRTGLFISRFLLSLFIAFPAGLVSSLLYEPAFKLANGMFSPGSRIVEHALVDKVDSAWVLDSPYWEHNFRWKVPRTIQVPPDATPGSVAKITMRSGLLGARWIESVEVTVLK